MTARAQRSAPTYLTLKSSIKSSSTTVSIGPVAVCLWGNPQWQIDAFRKFQIPDQLVEGYGYPKLTPEIKAKVFGQNAARIWNLKTTA